VWLEGIAESKIADFAGEAAAADADVMRKVAPLKRMALLACMVHVARTRARDDLAEMFCKRMASVTKLAKAELAELREREAEISERLIISYRSVLGCLDPRSTETADAAAAVRRARRIVEDAGGFDAQLAEIEAVISASREQLHAVGRQAPSAGPGDDVRVHEGGRAGGDERRPQRAGRRRARGRARAPDPRLHPRPSRRHTGRSVVRLRAVAADRRRS
jgi:hypothetical protein